MVWVYIYFLHHETVGVQNAAQKVKKSDTEDMRKIDSDKEAEPMETNVEPREQNDANVSDGEEDDGNESDVEDDDDGDDDTENDSDNENEVRLVPLRTTNSTASAPTAVESLSERSGSNRGEREFVSGVGILRTPVRPLNTASTNAQSGKTIARSGQTEPSEKTKPNRIDKKDGNVKTEKPATTEKTQKTNRKKKSES